MSRFRVVTLIARFTPTASSRRWSVRILATTTDGAELAEIDGGFVLRRPDLDDLAGRMAAANAGFVLRSEKDGTLEVSATNRATAVLRDWLDAVVKVRRKSGVQPRPDATAQTESPSPPSDVEHADEQTTGVHPRVGQDDDTGSGKSR